MSITVFTTTRTQPSYCVILVSVQLAVEVLALVKGDGEVEHLIAELRVAHGIKAFNTHRGIAVEDSFNDDAAGQADVQVVLIRRVGASKVQPVGRGGATDDADVVSGFRRIGPAGGRQQRLVELGLGRANNKEDC